MPHGARAVAVRSVPLWALRVAVAAGALGLALAVAGAASVVSLGRVRRAVAAREAALAAQEALTRSVRQATASGAAVQAALLARQGAAVQTEASTLVRLSAQVQRLSTAQGTTSSGGTVAPRLALAPLPPSVAADLRAEATGRSAAGEQLPGSGAAQAVLRAETLAAGLRGSVRGLEAAVAVLEHDLPSWRHAALETPSLWPVRGPVTSPFGWRPDPFGPGPAEFHQGVDIGVPVGTPVHATAAGVAVLAGPDGPYGLAVVLAHAGGIETLYGHNERLLVSAGQAVQQGQVIALSGDTGRSTGPHVHYGVYIHGRAVDPMNYLPVR